MQTLAVPRQQIFRSTLQSLRFLDIVLQYQQYWLIDDQSVIGVLRQLDAQPSLR